ncbi:uncharacterized protein IUM83_18531 [Phytophthora cinnamomi]|uniref:uncharacterized protein n=1 Tax=Phytophthora cinnamomi TaxID=4785 RepID=UPI003559EEB4|nr:hypothetical protein IUM83_18531 [Phytophthora cinnamomi]
MRVIACSCAMQTDSFDLDDAAPALLDFLDSLSDEYAALDAGVDARAVDRQVISSVEEVDTRQNRAAVKSKPTAKTKSNTWRQRQRLEVLRLRDEMQQLDAELKKMKLASGVLSTVPLVSSVCTAKRSPVRKLLHESWQDAASRESLARQTSDIENERLHKVLHMQVKHARKIYRMMTQQMTTAVVAQALGCRPGLVGDECRPPKDNSVVFQRLLAQLDGHHGNMGSLFVAAPDDRRRDGHVTINRACGLQVQILNSYTVPFSVDDTERAVWSALMEVGDRVAYNESFEIDSRTTLQSARAFIVAGSVELCFLVRKGCRKYVNGGQSFFVVHESAVVSTSFGGGVSYDEVKWRTVKPGKVKEGAPTATIETYVLATFPTYKALSCLPPEGLAGFHESLKDFNHKVEDTLVQRLSAVNFKSREDDEIGTGQT